MHAVWAYIQEVGVFDWDARQQVELVGALGGVPGHVVRLNLNLPSAEASRHQQECCSHRSYDEEQLHSICTASAITLQHQCRMTVDMCRAHHHVPAFLPCLQKGDTVPEAPQLVLTMHEKKSSRRWGFRRASAWNIFDVTLLEHWGSASHLKKCRLHASG